VLQDLGLQTGSEQQDGQILTTWDAMRGGFANTDKQGTLMGCECPERGIWCENIPTVAPFTQTGAVESMRAGYCYETSDGRIHPFETNGASR
jgi:hypothetical protein